MFALAVDVWQGENPDASMFARGALSGYSSGKSFEEVHCCGALQRFSLVTHSLWSLIWKKPFLHFDFPLSWASEVA